MSNSLIPLSDIKYALVMHQDPPKPSRYKDAGSPLSCFLPSCQKLFESSCFRGEDNHYYCSEACAREGIDADLAVVQPIRKRS